AVPQLNTAQSQGFEEGIWHGSLRLHVEFEENHVAVLDDVLAAFLAKLAGLAQRLFRAERHQVAEAVDLGLDEALLEVRVDDAGRDGRLVPGLYSPGAALVLARGEEGPQAEEAIGGVY